jgi:hypothetical protein
LIVPAIALGVIAVALFLIYSNSGGDLGAQVGAMIGSATSMTQNIATFAAQAGFVGNDLVTAVAIALAESGGNARAYNPEKQANAPAGKGSYGLWQIYLNAHPEFTNLDLYDPQTNANAAYSVYSKAGGFYPWSTYNNGAYQAQLAVAQEQVEA